MNDELPPPFGRLTLRPAPDELRARVLDAVAKELDPRVQPRWERAIEWAVAASLLLGIGLNFWQQRAEAAWQLRVFGAPTTPRAISEVAQAVASVTDAQTGLWVQQRLSTSHATPRRNSSLTIEQFERFSHDLTESNTHTKS